MENSGESAIDGRTCSKKAGVKDEVVQPTTTKDFAVT